MTNSETVRSGILSNLFQHSYRNMFISLYPVCRYIQFVRVSSSKRILFLKVFSPFCYVALTLLAFNTTWSFYCVSIYLTAYNPTRLYVQMM